MIRVAFGSGVAGLVAVTREVVNVADLRRDPRFAASR